MSSYRTNDIKLHFTDEGQGEPIVLVHGFALSAAMWQPQRAVLSQHYRVIAVDLRGFGSSDAPTGTMSMDTYADDIAALLDVLGIGQATFGGLSMGGYVVMAFLRRHLERVKAVMLLDTRMTADTAAGRQARDEMIMLAHEHGMKGVAEAMLPTMLTPATIAGCPALAEHVCELMQGASLPGVVRALEALRERPDSVGTLKGLTIPALVLTGSDDELTPPADGRAMAALLAKGEFFEIPHAAHLAPMEQPSAVNAHLMRFLGQRLG
ncbi:MAG: alpha/beta fold hydrolase [Herpetosiphon sp.]